MGPGSVTASTCEILRRARIYKDSSSRRSCTAGGYSIISSRLDISEPNNGHGKASIATMPGPSTKTPSISARTLEQTKPRRITKIRNERRQPWGERVNKHSCGWLSQADRKRLKPSNVYINFSGVRIPIILVGVSASVLSVSLRFSFGIELNVSPPNQQCWGVAMCDRRCNRR